MSTRYVVEWKEGEKPMSRGFAFGSGALDLWGRLVASERAGEGESITGATLRFLGPNGEREPDCSYHPLNQ